MECKPKVCPLIPTKKKRFENFRMKFMGWIHKCEFKLKLFTQIIKKKI